MSHVNTFMSLLNRGFSWYILIGTTGFISPLWNRIPRKIKKSFLWSPIQTLGLFSHSVMSDSATPWTAARQAFLSITNSQNLLKLMSIESVMPSNHLILCPPLLLLSSILPSIWVFSYESVLRTRWPKYWSFSFNAEAEIQTLDGAKFSLQVASLVLTAISPTVLGLHLRWKSSREWATLDLRIRESSKSKQTSDEVTQYVSLV